MSAIQPAPPVAVQLSSEPKKPAATALLNEIRKRCAKTIQRAAKIVVLDKGVLVEEGTHEERLGKNAYYEGLWREPEDGSSRKPKSKKTGKPRCLR